MKTPLSQPEQESSGKKWGKRALIAGGVVVAGGILVSPCDDCGDNGKNEKGPAPVSETQKDSHRRFLAAAPEYTAEADAGVPYDAEADGYATDASQPPDDSAQPQASPLTPEEIQQIIGQACAELRDSLTAGE